MVKFSYLKIILIGFIATTFACESFGQTVPVKKASHPWKMQPGSTNSAVKGQAKSESIKIDAPTESELNGYYSETIPNLGAKSANAPVKKIKIKQDEAKQEPASVVRQGLDIDIQDDKQQSLFDSSFANWPLKTIREVGIDIRDTSDTLPKDYSFNLVDSSEAAWEDFVASSKLFAWAAPNIRYQPLYFEDIALERYGQTYCGARQLTASAIHFATSATLLPYHMYVDAPRSCDYPLGFCRPGSCVSPVKQKHWYGLGR